MFFYFIIFIAIGFFLGFFKIEDEQKYGIALVIAIIWGIAYHPIWGIVSLMELALGLYLSTLLLQKDNNVETIVTETIEEDNTPKLFTSLSPSKDTYINSFSEWKDIDETKLDECNSLETPPSEIDEEKYISHEYDENDMKNDLYDTLKEEVDELNERITEMESYIAQLEFENERLQMEVNS